MSNIMNLEFNKGDSFERVFGIRGARITALSNTTDASITVSGILRTDILSVGMTVTGTGIQALTTIASIVDSHTITLSLPATLTQTDVSLLFANNDYIDIQAMTFRGHIRSTVTSATIQASFSFNKYVDNTVRMFLNPTQTSAMVGNSFVFDIEMASADELFVTKIIQGSVIANDEVTR